MVNNLISFNFNHLVPELTVGLLMKEAIAPSRQRPKLGAFVNKWCLNHTHTLLLWFITESGVNGIANIKVCIPK